MKTHIAKYRYACSIAALLLFLVPMAKVADTRNADLFVSIVIGALVPMFLNRMVRNGHPLGRLEGLRPTFGKHCDSILLAIVIGNILSCVLVGLGTVLGGKVGHELVLLSLLTTVAPLLWQFLSAPAAGFMLPHVRREWQAALVEGGYVTKAEN
jgi:hypothetical protein